MPDLVRRWCCRPSKRLAFLHHFLCVQSDESNNLVSGDEPLHQHYPTHAAASFLKTTTSASLRQNQDKYQSFDSGKTYFEIPIPHDYVETQAIDKPEVIQPLVTPPIDRTKAAMSPKMTLNSPSCPWISSYNFDTPYPSLPRRAKKMEGCGIKKSRVIPRDSMDLIRSNLAKHSESWTDV